MVKQKKSGKVDLGEPIDKGCCWIGNMLMRRDAQSSTVAVAITSDPKRMEEFIEWLREDASRPLFDDMKFEAREAHKKDGGTFRRFKRVLFYDTHLGLMEYVPQQTSTVRDGKVGEEVMFKRQPFSSGETKSNDPFNMEGIAAMGDPIRAAVKAADAVIRGEPTAFVVGNVPVKDDAFTAALRSWASDEAIYGSESLVVFFSEAPEEVIGRGTMEMCIVSDVDLSTPGERQRVITRAIEDFGGEVGGEINGKLTEATRGLNLHQTESAVLESIFRKGEVDLAFVSATKADLIKKSGTAVVKEPKHGFNRVGGYAPLKEYVKYAVIEPLTTGRDRAKKLGVEPPRGMLLFGPPGTGKTWFAQSLARELNMPFIELKPDMRSKWVGESERNFENFRKVAEASAPCVVFLDEVDEFGRRSADQHEVDRRVHNALLKWLGDADRRSIVVAATNLPEQLSDALTRDGRFDVRVPVMYPDMAARKEILAVHIEMKGVPTDTDVDLDKLASMTGLFSGAELEGVVKAAAKICYRDASAEAVAQRHFEQAIRARNIPKDERREATEKYIAFSEKGFCSDPEFVQALKDELVKDEGVGVTASRIDAMKKKMMEGAGVSNVSANSNKQK